MGCESLEFFVDKTVRLVKSDGFILTGKIIDVSGEKVLFKTNQATSLISLGNIKEIVTKIQDRGE